MRDLVSPGAVGQDRQVYMKGREGVRLIGSWKIDGGVVIARAQVRDSETLLRVAIARESLKRTFYTPETNNTSLPN